MSALLTVQHLAKRYGARQVLDDVSFVVHEGDRIALVGVNGAGKSTLLRFLAADDVTVGRDVVPTGRAKPDRFHSGPDAGLITRQRGLTVEYVAQEPRLPLDRTVGEGMREGLTVPDYEVRGLAAALAVPPETARIGNLSMGERRRVAIARALLAAPALLALDEPTNHLDAATTAWLEDRLIDRDGALLLVTHDRYFLDRVATRIIELDRGRIFTHEGGYRELLARQAERWSQEDEQRQKRAAFVRSELGWIRRRAPARTTKQKARIDRFEATVAAQETEVVRSGNASLKLGSGGRLGGTILELLDFTKRTPEGRTLIDKLTLRWKHGDRIGVVGPNGAGKTTLIRTILGELAADGGQVVVGKNTKFGFMDQARTTLDDDKTVLEEIAGDEDRIELVDGSVHVRTFLRMLLFDDAFADAKVGVLSGGERNRVQLAKLLRSAGNFLILDEPTNDLDVLTLGVLEDALAQFSGCALIVSHDRWFLDKVATGILAFEAGGVVFYEGSCSDYLARLPVPAPVPVPGSPPSSPTSPSSKPRPRRRTFNEQRELSGIESAISAAETSVADRERELADPDVYAKRGAEVPGLLAALDTARAEVDRLYARWQELEAIPE